MTNILNSFYIADFFFTADSGLVFVFNIFATSFQESGLGIRL